MQMLTKFESKSNRVKSISFHPTRPLLAAGLHNGSIQIWNYQTGTIADRLEEHDGPIRGLAFHPTRPLLVSGGDDYKIKLWDLKNPSQGRCQFTLTGHLDYVRTTYFHHEQPWILSSSDDQTIRIWNWSSRKCIAILTGHNHYIMCAQFHPTEDLVVSAAMDQTVRVWDISGLRKKSTSAQPMSIEEQVARANSGQADLFSNNDAVVKYVLEGHDRGVNWAAWHPTLPLIISAGDDRQIKLWRMSETRAWEVDSLRGHYNNVVMAIFHPRHDLIISASEDKTIRVWDLTKRTAVQTFRREQDRFWVLTAHPHLNLFAAGHDNGLIVFKLERERPAFSVHNNILYYVRDKHVRVHDFNTGSDASALSVRKLGNQYTQPRTLSFNPAERSVIVTSSADNGIFELAALPRDGAEAATEGKRGSGSSALFVARNRFAVLDKTAQTIEIRDLSNAVTKTFKTPVPTNEIFFGGTASLLLSTNTSVVLFDIQQQKVLGELSSPPVKYVIWSNDGSMVALLSKHTITIANKSLTQSSLIHETIRLKSGAWDDSGIFLYSTLNHIKYALPQGDNGIIKTLEQPVYLTRVKGKTVYCLDRSARPQQLPIDPTEYRFKLALVRGNYDEVLQIIRTSNLVGQAIIAYLQKKGFPEIALHFVQDKSTRFDLAIECGNLDVALEMAKSIDREDSWNRLAQQALKQGNHKVVEIAYQRTKNFDRLSFLYLITGNVEKLSKMLKISEMRGDQMSRFHNSLYLGDVKARIAVLRDVGLYPLAYLTAKSNGLEEEAAEIAEMAGVGEAQLGKLATAASSSSLKPPSVITPGYQYNWPTLPGHESFFDKALVAGADGVAIREAYANGIESTGAHLDEWMAGDGLVDADEGDFEEAGEEVEEAWDLEEPVAPEEDIPGLDGLHVSDLPDAPEGFDPGVAETDYWLRNSPLAADHIAAGSFQSAMTLLNRQVGVVEFAPLKALFMDVYRSAHTYLQANANLPPLEVHLRRNPASSEPKSALAVTCRTISSITTNELQEAYRAVARNKLPEAADLFRSILHSLVFVTASSESEASEIQDAVIICREYLLGIAVELERRQVVASDPSNVKRALELAAYFTRAQMQPAHLTLALRSAMGQFSKAGNYATAASFARRVLELNPAPNVVSMAQQIISAEKRSPRDAVEIEYDASSSSTLDICAGSHTVIAQGEPYVEDPLTGAKYKPEFKGTLCLISTISEVGRPSSGLRCII